MGRLPILPQPIGQNFCTGLFCAGLRRRQQRRAATKLGLTSSTCDQNRSLHFFDQLRLGAQFGQTPVGEIGTWKPCANRSPAFLDAYPVLSGSVGFPSICVGNKPTGSNTENHVHGWRAVLSHAAFVLPWVCSTATADPNALNRQATSFDWRWGALGATFAVGRGVVVAAVAFGEVGRAGKTAGQRHIDH